MTLTSVEPDVEAELLKGRFVSEPISNEEIIPLKVKSKKVKVYDDDGFWQGREEEV